MTRARRGFTFTAALLAATASASASACTHRPPPATQQNGQRVTLEGSFHAAWQDPPRGEPPGMRCWITTDAGESVPLEIDAERVAALGGYEALQGRRVIVYGMRRGGGRIVAVDSVRVPAP